MNRRSPAPPTPPRIAVWLLTRLTPAEHRDSIVGDLVERFSEGESRRWFWKQTAHALATALFNGLRRHTLSSVGALLAGCCVLLAGQWLDSVVRHTLLRWQTSVLFQIDPGWTHSFWWTVLFQELSIERPVVWFFGAGWVVSRIHRAHPRAISCAMAALCFAVALPWTIRLTQNAMGDPRYLNSLGWHLMTTVANTLAVAVAGFIPTFRKRAVTRS
jgi:hypothetical protein